MAQLGARFHGMKEVNGSILIRSTKHSNQPKLLLTSMQYSFARGGMCARLKQAVLKTALLSSVATGVRILSLRHLLVLRLPATSKRRMPPPKNWGFALAVQEISGTHCCEGVLGYFQRELRCRHEYSASPTSMDYGLSRSSVYKKVSEGTLP